MRNTYFVTCPKCGAHLDPGERCSCEKENEKQLRDQNRKVEGFRGRLYIGKIEKR